MALSAHVMMGEPVQFGLQEWDQFLQCSVVSAAPLAEKLGDLLSCRWRCRHEGCSTTTSLTRPGNFHSTAQVDQKLRRRGGFQARFPL
jgi:hypothetical protein